MGRVEVLRSESKGGDQAEVNSQGHCYPLEVSCFTNQAAPQEQVLESPEQPTQGQVREFESGVELQLRENEEEDTGLPNYKTNIKFVYVF